MAADTTPTQIPGFADTLRFTNTAALGLNPGNSNMNQDQQRNFMASVQAEKMTNASVPSPYTAPTVASTNATSPIKTQVPVVTAAAAQADFNQKQQTYNNLKNQISEQRSVLAQQAAQKAADDAQKAMLDAKNKLDQQQLSIQQQQADTAKTTADAKAAAAAGLTGGQTSTQTTGDQTTGGTTGNTTTGTTTSTTGSTTGTTDTGTGLLSQEATALSGIQDQRTQAFQDMKSQVAQIMNGTFPLSATEQSLITATQASFNNQIQAQQQANQADIGVQQEASFRQGGEYTPQIAAGQLAATIAYGVQKITNLDQQAALTVANLQQGFETKDYTMVNDLYDKLDKQLSDKSSSIKDLFSAAIANEKDLRDYNQRVSQFNQDQALKQQQFAETQKKDAADIQHMKNADYIAASGTWSVHDNPDGTQSLVNSRSGAIQAISPHNIVTGGGTPGNSGIPIVDNNTKTTSSGVPYVDGSSLTGKEAISAQNAAAKLLIPYIDKDNATILNNVETSRANIQNVQNDLQGLNPSSGLTRPLVALGHSIEGATQTGPGATQLNSFAADQSALIQTIKGMMSLKIVNRGELNTIINGGGMPTPNDTAPVVQAKIAKISNALNTAEKGIMGNKVYDKYNSDSALNDLQSYSSASSDHAAQVQAIRQANPTITPAQVLQLVQP